MENLLKEAKNDQSLKKIKMQSGFAGEKLISLPEALWTKFAQTNPAIGQIYITQMGYFPNARHHYRQRRYGCTDNILLYCLRGYGWYEIDGTTYNVEPNQFVIIPATDKPIRYGANEEEPWTIYWIHFSGQDMDAFNDPFEITIYDGPKTIPLNNKGLEIWESMYCILAKGSNMEHLRIANLHLTHFIATFFYAESERTEQPLEEGFFNTTITYMQSKLREKISVEELASRHQLSASYFSTLFRKMTGIPPMDYFINLKMQRACQLLSSGKMKVKEAALEIGYEDPFYFSRIFKKQMKITPEQYKAIRN